MTTLLLCGSLLSLQACKSTVDRLDSIGEQPPLKTVENPHVKPEYRPLTWPMPEPEADARQYANSLWQPGARSFFRDQRASRVGDILRVTVEINDKAEVDNETKRDRDAAETSTVTELFGSLAGKVLPGNAGVPLTDMSGTSNADGKGEIQREEKINTSVSAIVTQVLPNGNLVIDGSQEIRINYEIRELSVTGVVRPEDIGSDNTIDANQIAEARISYGGRGQLSDMQQPRWGYQVIDVVSPF
jgi:flagellar L-ring protein precursor FlgH